MTETVKEKKGLKLLLDNASSHYTRLPMLEVIYDRLVRTFSNSLRSFISLNAIINIGFMNFCRFGEYIDQIQTPNMIAIGKSIEWNKNQQWINNYAPLISHL